MAEAVTPAQAMLGEHPPIQKHIKGKMPKRFIGPVISHARSPLTARAAILVLLIGLIAYSALSDYLHYRRSEVRHQETLRNYENARLSREEIKQQTAITKQSLDQLDAAVGNIKELGQSMKAIADILKTEKAERERKNRTRRKRIPKSEPPKECYELRRRVEKMGAADVIVFDLVKKDSCP